MQALVIHESLTGNTREAALRIVAELGSLGWEATECTSREVDLPALQRADVVIVGTWVDGLILFGQRPGGAGKLRQLPLLGNLPDDATFVEIPGANHASFGDYGRQSGDGEANITSEQAFTAITEALSLAVAPRS